MVPKKVLNNFKILLSCKIYMQVLCRIKSHQTITLMPKDWIMDNQMPMQYSQNRTFFGMLRSFMTPNQNDQLPPGTFQRGLYYMYFLFILVTFHDGMLYISFNVTLWIICLCLLSQLYMNFLHVYKQLNTTLLSNWLTVWK